MFFMFSSLDERIDITLHPKFHIVINNVSKFGDNYDMEKIEQDPENAQIIEAANLMNEKRIQDIKTQLKDGAKQFYLTEQISDLTRIGSQTWIEIKSKVCQNENYKTQTWYKDLTEHEMTLIQDLRLIQLKIGINEPITPQIN